MLRSPKPRRKRGRQITLVATLSLFLLVNIEILKWEIVDFVLQNDQFELLRNNFLPRHHLLPISQQQQQQQYSRFQLTSPPRRLANLQEMESFPVTAFHFGFFENLYREPTQEEYEGLLCQTKAFYLQMFQRKLGDSIYVNLYSANWTYAPAEDKPVSHTVVVHATFEDGTPIPTEEVNQCIRAGDMAEFVERFVWAAEPRLDGTFFDTNAVTTQVGVANQRGYTHDDSELGGIVLRSSINCPANGYYEATFNFGFFPGYATKPDQSEIEDLIPLTETFFTHKLQESYTTRKVKVQMALMGWTYDDVTNPDMPLRITFRMLGVFEYGGDVIPLEYVKEKLAHDDRIIETIMQDYIQHAVWETPPFKQSSFWNVNRARMNSKIFRFSYQGEGGNEGLTAEGPAYGEDGYGSQNDIGGPGGMFGAPPKEGGGEDGDAPEGAGGQRGSGFDLGLGGEAEGEGESGVDRNDPSRSTILTLALGPVTVNANECRTLLKAANDNLDRFLTPLEYVTFANSMTNDTYIGYPYVALPDPVQAVFEGMSLKNDHNEEVIDLLGAYHPDISQEELNLLEDTRADKICQYFKSGINDAIARAPVESTKVNTAIDFFLENEANPDEDTEPNMGALNTAFQNLVRNSVGPGVEEAVANGLRTRKERKHRELSQRAMALRILRQLQKTSTAHVLPSSAKVNKVEESECREGESDPGKTCYNAEAGVDIFLKGDDAADVAPKVASKTEQMLEDAVLNGELEKELTNVDPSWKVSTKHMPTVAPSKAPSTAPTVAPPPTKPPTEVPKADEDKGFLGNVVQEAGGAGVATAAAGSVLLMVGLQCGREFLVDLMIRMCKICCTFWRGEEEDDSEFDSDYDSEAGSDQNDYSNTEGDDQFKSDEFKSEKYEDIRLNQDEEDQDDDESGDESDDESDDESEEEDESDDEEGSEEEESEDEENSGKEDSSEEEDASQADGMEMDDSAAPAPAPAPFVMDRGMEESEGEQEESKEGEGSDQEQASENEAESQADATELDESAAPTTTSDEGGADSEGKQEESEEGEDSDQEEAAEREAESQADATELDESVAPTTTNDEKEDGSVDMEEKEGEQEESKEEGDSQADATEMDESAAVNEETQDNGAVLEMEDEEESFAEQAGDQKEIQFHR